MLWEEAQGGQGGMVQVGGARFLDLPRPEAKGSSRGRPVVHREVQGWVPGGASG